MRLFSRLVMVALIVFLGWLVISDQGHDLIASVAGWFGDALTDAFTSPSAG